MSADTHRNQSNLRKSAESADNMVFLHILCGIRDCIFFLGIMREKRVTRVTLVTRQRKKPAITDQNGVAESRPGAPNASPTRHQRVTEPPFVPHIAMSAEESMSHYATGNARRNITVKICVQVFGRSPKRTHLLGKKRHFKAVCE